MNKRLRIIGFGLLLFANGCGNPDKYLSADSDQDGYNVAVDCDDGNAQINPNAVELCNGFDDNCNGLVDDDDPNIETENKWYLDSDGDGFGVDGTPALTCLPLSGYVANKQDCNDANAAINPEAVEVCNGFDDNCDGDIDDNPVDGSVWYLDSDGDGFGVPYSTVVACSPPMAYADNNIDCDDFDALVYPEAPEVCDGEDNDCNGYTDTEDPNIDMSTGVWYYPDLDGDGFGATSSGSWDCFLPEGYAGNNLDCDDADSEIHPNAIEICDGVDNDCNTSSSENDMVSEQTLGGWVDVSSLFFGGSPVEVSITQDTELLFCPGYYDVQFSVEANLTLNTVGDGAIFSNSTGVVFDIYNSTVLMDGIDIEYSTRAVSCSASDLTIQNGRIHGQYSLDSSIINLNNCELTLDSVLLEDNVVYANSPFLSAESSVLNLNHTHLTNNVNGQSSAGIYLNQSEMQLTYSTIVGQQGGLHRGVLLNNSNLSCLGSSQDFAGIYDSSIGGAQSQSVALTGSSTFNATDCEFGGLISAGEDVQSKILIGDIAYAPEGQASLSCDSTSCTGNTSQLSSGASFSSTPERFGFVGNVYTVSGNPTALDVTIPISANGHCEVQLALWTRSSSVAPWDLKSIEVLEYWSGSVLSFSEQGVMLKDGEQLGLGMGWACDLNVALSYFETGSGMTGIFDYSDTQLEVSNFSGQNLINIGLQENSAFRQFSHDVVVWEY